MSSVNLDVVQPTTEQPQRKPFRKYRKKLYEIPIADQRSFSHQEGNEYFYDTKARTNLGVLAEVGKNEFKGDPEGEYILGNGWSCKWYHIQDKYVLKLKATDGLKQRCLDEGVISFFVKKGLRKFYAVALLNARVKYKFQLIETLVKVINNEGYLQAFRHHPAYGENYSPHLSHEWVSRWCMNIDFHDTGIFQDRSYPILFELVKMVKVVDESEKYRQRKELMRKQEETKEQK